MDTEFVRIRTYKPQMGLIQLRVRGQNYIIDPLESNLFSGTPSASGSSALTRLLNTKSSVKVFHAAFQDIELLYSEFDLIPQPLFDTQIAASFLGFGISVSFEAMVEHCCGISLDKSSQFTDWTRRPLSQKQIDYAVRDVHYLEKVHLFLEENLKEKGYHAWALEEMQTLLEPKNYTVDLETVWQRAKPSSRDPLFLARLREVAAFREELAIKWNRARSGVFSNEIANKIAEENPGGLKTLLKWRDLPRELKNSGTLEGLLQRLKAVDRMDPQTYPKLRKWSKLSRPLKEKVNQVKESLNRVSEETGIAASVIAKAKEIEAFVQNPEGSHRFLTGWRHEVFGKKAIELL